MILDFLTIFKLSLKKQCRCILCLYYHVLHNIHYVKNKNKNKKREKNRSYELVP